MCIEKASLARNPASSLRLPPGGKGSARRSLAFRKGAGAASTCSYTVVCAHRCVIMLTHLCIHSASTCTCPCCVVLRTALQNVTLNCTKHAYIHTYAQAPLVCMHAILLCITGKRIWAEKDRYYYCLPVPGISNSEISHSHSTRPCLNVSYTATEDLKPAESAPGWAPRCAARTPSEVSFDPWLVHSARKFRST